MTKRLSPEEKRARAEARKAAKIPPPQGETKESTMDSSTDQTDPAGAAEPEIASNAAGPEGELKVETLEDQIAAQQGEQGQEEEAEPPAGREAEEPFLPTGGTPRPARKPESRGLGRLLAAVAQLRGEHRRTQGTGYPRLFIDNVCRELDAYERELGVPPEEQPGQRQIVAPAVQTEQTDGPIAD